MRLNKGDREFLFRQVKETVVDEKAKVAHDKVLKEVSEEIYKKLLEKYPQKDMEVLLKYHAASTYNKTSFWVDNFTIEVRFPKPILMPGTYDMSKDEKEKLRVSTILFDRANEFLRKPYRELINASLKWEQIVDSWPMAKQWIPARGDVALIALSPETKNFVKKDSAKREWRTR
jgi:hypothetical protein